MQPSAFSPRKGFTLVELAIVMVVIGLVIGGIMVGQTMFRASTLQAVMVQAQKYKENVSTFREKYTELPGDMSEATNLWGAVSAGCTDTQGTGTQTCNGNGDGRIAYSGPTRYEYFRAWQHLANAGMIQGSYTGKFRSGGGASSHDIGVNAPQSAIEKVGYSLAYIEPSTGGGVYYDGVYNNSLYIGRQSSNGIPSQPFLTPSELKAIDTKMDDGRPGTGTVLTWTNDPSGLPDCATTAVPGTADYNTAITSRSCSIILPRFVD